VTPPPHDRGQAAADYVALLAMVAVVLAGAGSAGALDGVPARVSHAVRVGLCIVGGDVCRTADARADGLDPCVVGEQTNGGGLQVTLFSIRFGEMGEWTVAERSDGTVLVTRADDRRAGVGAGFGFELGAAKVGISGSFDATFGTGRAWELPSLEAAGAFIARVRERGDGGVPPTWRFAGAGERLEGRLGLDVAGVELTGIEATATVAAGVRTGRGTTTTFVDAGLSVAGPLDVLPGLAPPGSHTTSAAPGGRRGPLVVALTRDRGGLRELEFRRVEAAPARPAESDRMVETVARLDLRDPANRAAAAPLLDRRLPWPPGVVADLRAVLRHTATHGTVERAVYAVRDRSHELAGAGRIGIEFGLEATAVDVARRLVAASAWTRGSPERHREDCTGTLG
jgi:hypothetical protein